MEDDRSAFRRERRCRYCDLPYFAALVVIVWLGFFPGIMNNDSTGMLKQAVTGDYIEWHSPLLSFLWGLANHIIFGPASLTLFCNILFFAAIYAFLIRLFESPWHRMAVVTALVAWPPVADVLGSATKDNVYVSVMMATSLCFIAAMGLPQPTSRRWKVWLWAIFAILALVAELVRREAFVPVIPMVAAGLFAQVPSRSATLRLAISTVLAVACGGVLPYTARLVNRGIFLAQPSDPTQPTELFDIAGISLCLGQNLMPAYIVDKHGIDDAELRNRYRYYGSMPLVWAVGQPALISHSEEEIGALRSAWLAAIKRSPGCYLRHRLPIAGAFLGILERPRIWQYQWISDVNPGELFPNAAAMGADYAPGPLSRAYHWLCWHIVPFVVFAGWPYVAASVALAGWGLRLAFGKDQFARGAAAMAIAAGVMLSFLALSIVASDALTRYVYWPIISLFLGWLVVVSGPPAKPSLVQKVAADASPNEENQDAANGGTGGLSGQPSGGRMASNAR